MTDRAELAREQFEAWARSKGHYLGRGWNEDYGSAITRSDWALWQAATQAQAERIDSVNKIVAVQLTALAGLRGRIAQLARELDAALAMSRTLEEQRDEAVAKLSAAEADAAQVRERINRAVDRFAASHPAAKELVDIARAIDAAEQTAGGKA